VLDSDAATVLRSCRESHRAQCLTLGTPEVFHTRTAPRPAAIKATRRRCRWLTPSSVRTTNGCSFASRRTGRFRHTPTPACHLLNRPAIAMSEVPDSRRLIVPGFSNTYWRWRALAPGDLCPRSQAAATATRRVRPNCRLPREQLSPPPASPRRRGASAFRISSRRCLHIPLTGSGGRWPWIVPPPRLPLLSRPSRTTEARRCAERSDDRAHGRHVRSKRSTFENAGSTGVADDRRRLASSISIPTRGTDAPQAVSSRVRSGS
jgi:hypothetical protein